MKRTAEFISFRAVCFLMLSFVSLFLNAQEGATLQVEPLAGQNTFHVGERIPLELSFSSLTKDRFEINMASYDRSGRMSYEQFDISPKAGWSDPLVRYFSTGGGFGGGITSFGVLSSTPTSIPIDLNEWVRFDHPGTYRVAVSSRRVSDQTKKHVFNSDPPDPLQSKSFVLHIIPASAEWQAAKLQASLAQLAAVPSVQGQPPAERKAAIADLRFLGTEGALRELAGNLRDDRADFMHQSAFGLMGVTEPMRDVAIEALEQRVEDPLFPISGWFIQTMAVLVADGDRSRSNEEVWHKVLAALPRKEGKARAATVQTLLSNPPASVDSESKRELAGILSASFLDLTEQQRAGELMWQWDLLRSASMLPVLQASARLTLTHPGSNEMTVYSRRELKSAALARWYELDPEGATQEILLQIGSATPSLTAQTLAFLPKLTLPQFEPIWAQRLVESSDYQEEAVLGGLLVRFGTGSASALIAEKLRAKAGAWACAPQAAALAYLLKFAPDQARPLLEQAVDSGSQGKTGCHQTLFQDVSAHASGAVLTDVAVASLGNADRRDSMDALIYLANHGRKEDRKSILDRYAKWSEQWSGKAEVLDLQDQASAVQNYPEIGLGENLARALIANQGWVADKNLIARVVKMCVGQQVCSQVQQIAASAGPPYHVTVYRNASSENYQVGQYSAKSMELLDQKVAQYPKGTIFQLIPTTPQNRDQTALESEAREIFQRNGMSLEAAPN